MKPADCATEPVEALPEDALLVPTDAVSALAPLATAVVPDDAVVDVAPEVVPVVTAVAPVDVVLDVPVFTELLEVVTIAVLVVKFVIGCEAVTEIFS
jgi:hypothetical protein